MMASFMCMEGLCESEGKGLNLSSISCTSSVISVAEGVRGIER